MSEYEMGWCYYCLEPKPVRKIGSDGWMMRAGESICEQCDQRVADELDRKWREEYPR